MTAAVVVEERSQQVLDAMERRLAKDGIRAVVISDLARELGMSTKTLYRLYPSKDDLVLAVVERWADRLQAAQRRRTASDMTSGERVRSAVKFLVWARSQMSDQFWSDLRSDHPKAWARYRAMASEGRRRSSTWMTAAMRPGVDEAFARSVLNAAVEHALDPAVRRRSGQSREEAIDAVVDIWAHGVFVDPDSPPPPPPASAG